MMIPAWLRGGCDCPKINPFVVIFGDRFSVWRRRKCLFCFACAGIIALAYWMSLKKFSSNYCILLARLSMYIYYSLSNLSTTVGIYLYSTEDMSFEFKKAFEKAVEKRSLTFNQQWAMSDMAIFSSEAPVQLALYNVPPGKKFSIRQLQGTYGPFLIKSTHYEVYQENC